MRDITAELMGGDIMKQYVWLFPLIFIFHDMEEIIGYGIWLKRNKTMLEEKYPGIIKSYKDFSTEGFSLAVFEEFLLSVLFSALSLLTDYNFLWFIWLGGFIGCALHFVIHIGQSVILRQYIPAVITSIICLPISCYVIYKCILSINIDYKITAACFIILGVALVGINLKFVQMLIGWFTRKMNLPPLI